MKKILFFYLRKLFPAALLTFIIIYFWSSQEYWVATQNEIFDPATLKIFPIEYQTVTEIIGIWKYFLLVTFNLLFFLGLAYLFKFKIQKEEYFPRKIFLGIILIALSVVLVFAPVIFVSISSNQSSFKICSELSNRRNIVKGLVQDYQKSLLNKKPKVDEIKRLIQTNSFSILAQNIHEYYSFSKPIEDSVFRLKDVYKEIFDFKKILEECGCSDIDSLLSFPNFDSPIYELANLTSELMDSVLMKTSRRKKWDNNKLSEFLSVREGIGEQDYDASPERLEYYCTLGDSFYRRSEETFGIQCYEIASSQIPTEVVKHLHLEAAIKPSVNGLDLEYQSQILSIINRQCEYMGDFNFINAMSYLIETYYIRADSPFLGGKDTSAYEGLGLQSFKILLDHSIPKAIECLHGISSRYRSKLLSAIKNRFTNNRYNTYNDKIYYGQTLLDSLSSFIKSGEYSIAKELWNLAVDLNIYTYNVLVTAFTHDLKSSYLDHSELILLRLWGNEILTDSMKMAWVSYSAPILEPFILSDQKKYSRLIELGTRFDDEGRKQVEPFLYALAFKETNEELFNMYKQQLWDDIKDDNEVLWVCELFSKIGIYMMQFSDTTAVRLAISDFDNAIAFWTESYGGWMGIGKYHSDQKQLAYYAAKRSEAINKLALLRQ